jgi:hypothetical protein
VVGRAGLATVAVGGAILTLGLVQRWGEVFPRWIPFLSGKRVPIWLAVIPASLVAVIVTNAGLMFVRLTLDGALAFAEEGVGKGPATVSRNEFLGALSGERGRRARESAHEFVPRISAGKEGDFW